MLTFEIYVAELTSNVFSDLPINTLTHLQLLEKSNDVPPRLIRLEGFIIRSCIVIHVGIADVSWESCKLRVKERDDQMQNDETDNAYPHAAAERAYKKVAAVDTFDRLSARHHARRVKCEG
jgi:hypothetical protein